jgi:hypothetical protein
MRRYAELTPDLPLALASPGIKLLTTRAIRKAHLLRRGPRTFAQIAEELNAKMDSVTEAVKRSDGFTRLSGPDGVDRIALVERRIA